MTCHVLVWDIETVPNLAVFAAANGHDGQSDEEIRAELGTNSQSTFDLSDVLSSFTSQAKVTLHVLSRVMDRHFCGIHSIYIAVYEAYIFHSVFNYAVKNTNGIFPVGIIYFDELFF
jgi:hypothetical protein